MEEKPADWSLHYEWPFDRERRICMKILGDPNPVVRALGLDITLPDPDADDVGKWFNNPGSWKIPLRGRIADPNEQEDPDWALLMAPDWGRVWFDLEEGVIVYGPIEQVGEMLAIVAALRAHDVPLLFPNGKPRVWIMPGYSTDDALVDELAAAVEGHGFVPNKHRSYWELKETG